MFSFKFVLDAYIYFFNFLIFVVAYCVFLRHVPINDFSFFQIVSGLFWMKTCPMNVQSTDIKIKFPAGAVETRYRVGI